MNPKTKALKIIENSTFLVFLTLGILLNLSCKKKNMEENRPLFSQNSQSENPPWGYIKSISDGSSIEYYEYDSLHRITTAILNGDTGKYTYNGDILIYTSKYSSNNQYKLNEMGFVVFPPGYAGKFYYDSLGHCLGFSTYTFHLYNYWKDGNLIRKVRYYPCPDPYCYSDTTDYIYHLDSLNSFKGTKEMIYGNYSKNVISRTNYRDPTGKNSFTDYTYEWDEKGRIARERRLQDSTGLKIISYQYFD